MVKLLSTTVMFDLLIFLFLYGLDMESGMWKLYMQGLVYLCMSFAKE